MGMGKSESTSSINELQIRSRERILIGAELLLVSLALLTLLVMAYLIFQDNTSEYREWPSREINTTPVKNKSLTELSGEPIHLFHQTKPTK